MGLFEKLFGNKQKENTNVTNYFKMLNGYAPVFTNAPEGVYEMELTRSAIHTFAKFCAKLQPEVNGSAYPSLGNTLRFRANEFMDTYKFVYRLATILKIHNTAFIVPVEDVFGNLVGYYPPLPHQAKVIEIHGEVYLEYIFADGKRATVEFSKVGILTQFQYSSDFFGENNSALQPTMQLIHTQNEGIINGVKNSANIRFLAKIANILKPEDIKKERDRFTEDNLSSKNQSGMIIYDNKFSELKQVDSKPFITNAPQMTKINENVFNYFNTNEDILQNKFNEDTWGAYYEGEVETFAIQLSLVMSNMTYSQRQLAHENSIIWTADRLQYASNKTKLDVSTQLFDRALLSRNGVMDIWNKAHVEDGDKYYIRKEYAEVNQLGKEETNNANNEGQGVPTDGTTTVNSDPINQEN